VVPGHSLLRTSCTRASAKSACAAFDAGRRIMETRPTPIVIVSGAADATDTSKVLRAVESGALPSCAGLRVLAIRAMKRAPRS
jgi:hypothetical protein